MAKVFSEADLITNRDGSIYHLHLQPDMVADRILLVGDPQRVRRISRHFDRIEHRVASREFVTHTGYLGNTRLSVISTGIGTDNIDIVLHELDALVNIDLLRRVPLRKRKKLQIIRLGTTGAVQSDINPGSMLVSVSATGIDAIGDYYGFKKSAAAESFEHAVQKHLGLSLQPYQVQASARMVTKYGSGMIAGHTVTAPGFYAPQGRQFYKASKPDVLNRITSFRHRGLRFSNMEMETAGIYLLSKIMGHDAVSLNAVLANRITGKFMSSPGRVVDDLIRLTLDRL